MASFFRDVSEFACPRMNEWVKSGYVNKITEGFLFAAQEQALTTNWLKARTGVEGVDARCRKCKKQAETVAHLASGCGELIAKNFAYDHCHVLMNDGRGFFV